MIRFIYFLRMVGSSEYRWVCYVVLYMTFFYKFVFILFTWHYCFCLDVSRHVLWLNRNRQATFSGTKISKGELIWDEVGNLSEDMERILIHIWHSKIHPRSELGFVNEEQPKNLSQLPKSLWKTTEVYRWVAVILNLSKLLLFHALRIFRCWKNFAINMYRIEIISTLTGSKIVFKNKANIMYGVYGSGNLIN